MPWPPVLRTPSSALDIIFYVRGGKFHVSVRDSLTKSRRSATERVGPLPAPVVIEHRLPDKSRCRTAFSPILVVMVQAPPSGRSLCDLHRGGSLTAVSHTGGTAPDSGILFGHPVDPDLREQTRPHWPDVFPATTDQKVGGSSPSERAQLNGPFAYRQRRSC